MKNCADTILSPPLRALCQLGSRIQRELLGTDTGGLPKAIPNALDQTARAFQQTCKRSP